MANEYFEKYDAGDIREQMLASFRESLRSLVNPETGVPFSEDVIRQATMEDSRFWVEANDLDLVLLGIQRRDYFVGQQIDPRLSSSVFLENFHGPALALPRLLATGGSGTVQGDASPGTTFIGSTTIPNAIATQAKDKAGLKYQVFINAVANAQGKATMTLVGIDTGPATNLKVGDELQWINPPGGAAPKCKVIAENFRGGVPTESDQEWGDRLFEARSRRPRAGNPGHFMLWARRSMNAVEQAFIYPCGLHAGSVVVCVTQKRGVSLGPLARIAGLVTTTVVGGYLTPPGSPVVPGRVHVVVTAANAQSVDMSLRLALAKGLPSGWAQALAWPGFDTLAATINDVDDQTHFRMHCDTPLPAVGVPEIMVWNEDTSRFERLSVVTITPATGDNYDVVLSAAPEKTLDVGDVISPYTARHEAVAKGIESYFDALGPGEIIDLSTDVRAVRAFRRPIPQQRFPYQITADLLDFVRDSIGSPITGSTIAASSVTTPSTPVTPSQGPNLLVPGKIGVYATT
jgi:hypothetical protein